MSFCMFIMWAASVLYVVLKLIPSDIIMNTHDYVSSVIFILGVMGLGGYQANSIQFGVDQLIDASSNLISVGTYGLSFSVML